MAHRFHTARRDTTHHRQRYGPAHQQARRAYAARHHPTDPCCRCGQPLGPMSPTLHLDHNDDGRTYRGFSHSTCNKRAGAIRGNRIANRQRKPRAQSRNW